VKKTAVAVTVIKKRNEDSPNRGVFFLNNLRRYIVKPVKMPKRIYFFLLPFLLPVYLSAQWTDTIHNIMHGKIYPTATFDSRNSFISSKPAHIWGVKAGLDFNGYLQVGLGFNRLNRDLRKQIYFTNADGNADSASGELRFAYFSYYLRYVYFKSNRWRFSIMPLQVGVGNSKYVYESSGTQYKVARRSIILYEPGISVSFKIFKWLGVGGDIGYRFMLRGNPGIPENFNAPTFSFYAIVYWWEIYKLCFPRSELIQKF
jgi:hypothetical protein